VKKLEFGKMKLWKNWNVVKMKVQKNWNFAKWNCEKTGMLQKMFE
jgi:hypothetical protein